MHRACWVVAALLLAGCAGVQDDRGPDDEADGPSDPGDPSDPTRPALGNVTAVWTTRAAFPEDRGEVACAAMDGRIYVFGGYAMGPAGGGAAGRVASPRLDVYDGATDSWSRAADAPVGMHHAAVVAWRGALYVPGGYVTADFQGSNLFLRYSPSDDAWTVVDLLPQRRGAHAAVVVGDDVYLVGGRVAGGAGQVHDAVDIYNFTTQQWRSGPALGVAREHVAAGLAEGRIVAFGGRPGTLNVTESLVPGASAWTVEAPMPTARSGLATAAWGSELVVFGGEMPGVFNETEGFDMATGSWRVHPPMPQARHGLCAATLEDGIHVIAGGVQQGFSLSRLHTVLEFRLG